MDWFLCDRDLRHERVKMDFEIGGSDKTKNSFAVPFIASGNSQITLLDILKLFMKRKSDKYSNDKYYRHFINKLI